MNKILFFILLAVISVFPELGKAKKFPDFSYFSSDSIHVTNEIFDNRNSVVVLGHIGCPPLMQFIKDIQESKVDDEFQIIFILENTHLQVNDFNSSDDNTWSKIRKYFKVDPVDEILIPECEVDNTESHGGDIIISTQCRKLSKILRTKVSPTLYLVDSKGDIIKSLKGYYSGESGDDRLAKLLN